MSRTEKRTNMSNAYICIHRPAVNKSSDIEDINLKVTNISKGGVRFCSNDATFEVDEQVELEVYIDDKLSHTAHGRVCYHDEDSNHDNYYGISFMDRYLHFSNS